MSTIHLDEISVLWYRILSYGLASTLLIVIYNITAVAPVHSTESVQEGNSIFFPMYKKGERNFY